MPKATFTKRFVWSPRRGVRIVYDAGKTYGITQACHDEAFAAGAVSQPREAYVPRRPMRVGTGL